MCHVICVGGCDNVCHVIFVGGCDNVSCDLCRQGVTMCVM